MTNGKLASLREAFPDIVKSNEPLAPYTLLKIGGPAELMAQPRSAEELCDLIRRCFESDIPFRVLGGGGNILISDSGVKGVVARLTAPAFTAITASGKQLHAGCGAALSALISQAARHGLAGLENFVGFPGTVGGALRCNVGDRTNDIGPQVQRVEVIDRYGKRQMRERDELRFSHRGSNLDEPALLSAQFVLESDDESSIVKRMRKAWIQRKAHQPYSFQAAGRLFCNPRGFVASELIDQAGLTGTRVGGAQISERDANFVVVGPQTPSRDVAALIELVQSRIAEQYNVELELDISVW